MGSRFIGESTPVVITSFGYEVDGQVNRVYYVVKRATEDIFLTDSTKPLWKKSWCDNVTKSAVWDKAEQARVFARLHFSTVKVDMQCGTCGKWLPQDSTSCVHCNATDVET